MRLRAQAKAQIWQEQVEVLTGALQQANAEKAVLSADKARLEQEVASLRLQMGVMGKALEMAQIPGANGGSINIAAAAPAKPASLLPVRPLSPRILARASRQRSLCIHLFGIVSQRACACMLGMLQRLPEPALCQTRKLPNAA